MRTILRTLVALAIIGVAAAPWYLLTRSFNELNGAMP